MIRLFYGCPMCCSSQVHDTGICPECRDHSENVWIDEDGNEYSDEQANELLETGEAEED